MSSVEFPLFYTCLGSPAERAPVEAVKKEITSISPSEVLVKVAYASINAMDPKVQQLNLLKAPFPVVMGFDFSGTIVSIGANVPNLKVGDKVFGYSFPAGACFAEFLKIDHSAVRKTGNLPLAEAVAYGIAYLSAYEPLVLVADIKSRKGETIYIPGGAGGVGHFAVQLAKKYGLTVIASGGKPASLDLLKKLGADHIIDYKKQDVAKEVLRITGGEGVQLVYDATNMSSSFLQSAAVVAAKGMWVKLGVRADDSEAKKILESRGAVAAIGDLSRYSFNPEFQAKRTLLFDGLQEAIGLYEEGLVKPYITGIIPFDAKDLQQALDRQSKGEAYGKVILEVSKSQ